MPKKTEIKTEKIEREYIIPLREKCRKVPRYKKTNKAIRTIKEFLVKHMKIRDRDLRKIKIDKYLNEFIWNKGIRNPPYKIKVKAIKEIGKDEVRAELYEIPEKLKFKKLREERIESKAEDIIKKKKIAEKLEETKKEEKTEEEKEKKAAVVEAGKDIEKAAAKQAKHAVKDKTKQPKHQRRMALQK